MKLAVVIVTYNSADVLGELLDSLKVGLEGVPDPEIIVVDNNSADGSAELAEAHPSGVRVIRTGRNAGYAGGINIAGDALDADTAMLILNPDIRLMPGSVRELMNRAADPYVGVVVPLIWNHDGTVATSLRHEPSLRTTWPHVFFGPALAAKLGVGEMIASPRAYAESHAIDWATGAILLVTPRARSIVGRWDESFFLYSEEVDFQRRVRDAGMTVLYEAASQVVHIGGAYMQSPALNAMMTSNQIRYFSRHHGMVATLAYRLALIASGLARIWRSPAHRAALLTAMSPLRSPLDYLPAEGRNPQPQAPEPVEMGVQKWTG